jgi:catecholate siderophore receptor
MPKSKRRPLAAAVMIAFSAPQGALAQARPEQTLPEVNVRGAQDRYRTESSSTATRTDTPLRDVPQTITIVPKELLQQQNAVSLQDALRNVTGITFFAGEGGQMGDGPRMRGFESRGSIFIDGIRDKGEYYRDTFNLESIEVLKGASSLLYGRGSPSGVINQVTKAPGLVARNEAALTFGRFDFKRATADLNLPLGETTAVRLNAMAQDNESHRDFVEGRRVGFAPSVRFGIGTPTEVSLYYQYLRSRDVPDYGVLQFFGKPAEVPTGNFYGFPTRDYDNLDTHIAALRVDHRFSDRLSLRNTLMWAKYERDNEVTAPRLRTGAAAPTAATPLAAVSVRRNDRKSRLEDNGSVINQTEAVWKASTGGLAHTVLAGVELGQEEIDRTTYAFPGLTETSHLVNLLDPDPANEGAGFGKTPQSMLSSKARSLAFYGQDQVEIAPQWKAVAGLRWDRYSVDQTTDQIIASGTTPVGVTSLARTDKVASTRAGLIWQPGPRQSYYISYGTAFSPSAELGTLAVSNASVEPEKVRSYETGAKLDVLRGVSVTAALFRNEKTNERVADPAGGPSQVLEGARRVDGVELGVAGRITPAWDIFAGVALMDGKITSQPTTPANVGKRPSFVAEKALNVWTTYRIAEHWEAGGGVYRVGDYFADDPNNTRIPGYTRWDATLAYVQKQYEIRFNLQNVFDETYYESAHPAHVKPGIPRQAFATLVYRY